RLSGRAAGQYLYFKEYANQRSWNDEILGRWEAPLARFLPYVTGSFASTRERPGFEIDSRARRRDDSVGVGTEVRLSTKTSIIVGAKRVRFEFDKDASFLGSNLATTLNRVSDTAEAQLLYRMTPLTTFGVRAEGAVDRFTFDHLRDANSVKVMSGF